MEGHDRNDHNDDDEEEEYWPTMTTTAAQHDIYTLDFQCANIGVALGLRF